MHDTSTPYAGSFQQLADARRALKATKGLSQAPVLAAEDREELARIRELAIRCMAASISELIETLDVLESDPDLEDDDPVEGDGTRLDAAWVERVDQTSASPMEEEDEEPDDEDCAQDEGEPNFGLLPKLIRRHLGPGCLISDNDHGGEEIGEQDGAE